MAFRGSFRLLERIDPFIRQLKPPDFFTSTVECFIVFIHCRWGPTLLSIFLVSSLFGWYHEDNAICYSKFDRTLVVGEMHDMCITYPFVTFAEEGGHERRVYALHYKWIPYAFGLSIAFFIGLQLAIKKLDDNKVRQHIELLLGMAPNIDRYHACVSYFMHNIGRHGHLAGARTKALMLCIATNVVKKSYEKK